MVTHMYLDHLPDNVGQLLLPLVSTDTLPQQKTRVELTWGDLENTLGKEVTGNIKQTVGKRMHCEMVILLLVPSGYEVPPHYDAAAQQAVLYLTPCESAAGRLHYKHKDGSVEVHPTDAKTLVLHNGRDTMHWTPATERPRFTLTFADRCGEAFRCKMMRAIHRYHHECYPMWIACHDKDGTMVEDCVLYIQRLYNGRSSDPPDITAREYAQRIEDMRNVLAGRAYSLKDVLAYVCWMDKITSATRRKLTKADLSPTERVDEIWHLHLQSPDYVADMNEVWRREQPVIHVPEPMPRILEDEKKNDWFAFPSSNTYKASHVDSSMDINQFEENAKNNAQLLLAAVVAFNSAPKEAIQDALSLLPATGLDGAFTALAQNHTFVTSLRNSYAHTAMDDDEDSETAEKAKVLYKQICKVLQDERYKQALAKAQEDRPVYRCNAAI